MRSSPPPSPNDSRLHLEILNGPPVASVRLEDAPQGKYKALVAWASELFVRQGGKAIHPELGQVVLNEQSVRDSLAHGGANAAKRAAFAAVKDVIEKGAVFHRVQGSRQDSFYIAAPMEISGLENMAMVLVRRDVNTQRMYLHGVGLRSRLQGSSVSAADAKASKPHSATAQEGDWLSVLRGLMVFNAQTK